VRWRPATHVNETEDEVGRPAAAGDGALSPTRNEHLHTVASSPAREPSVPARAWADPKARCDSRTPRSGRSQCREAVAETTPCSPATGSRPEGRGGREGWCGGCGPAGALSGPCGGGVVGVELGEVVGHHQ
jgi:hypothetical protein